MLATNSIIISEKQEDFFYKVIEDKLTKLGFDDVNTHHFSFMGTRGFCSEHTDGLIWQVLFEFGNEDKFYHLSCDLNKSKGIKIKTLTLEDQELFR